MKCGCRETQKSRISLTSNHFGKSWQHVNSSHINYSEPGTLIPGLCCHLGLLMKENAQGNTERSSQCDTAWNSSITKLAVKIWDRGWTPNSKEVTKVLHAVRKKRKKKKKNPYTIVTQPRNIKVEMRGGGSRRGEWKKQYICHPVPLPIQDTGKASSPITSDTDGYRL